MIFTQFHWGDWVRSTQDLTPLERGVYIDLLQRYYQKERPIMDAECKRIARAYANAEQEAMQYVLQTFFTHEEDQWRHERCDAEIAKANAVSAKRADAAKRSWESRNTQKKRVNPEFRAKDEANAMQTQYERNANAEQVQSNCNASALLTINHKPITINKEVVPNGTTRQNALGTASAVPANAPAAPSPAAPSEDLFEGEVEAEPKESRFDRKDAKYPPCPYKEIVGLWHEILPELPRVNKLSVARQKIVNARWKETFDEEGCKDAKECLEAFRYIFGMIRDSNFLMGRTKRSPGHENWQPTFMWVMKQENFLKVTNRDYERF